MAYTLSAYEKAAISGTQYPYRVGVLIEAETTGGQSTWVDLNKEIAGAADDPAFRLLTKMPTVTLESEVRPGRFSTAVTPLTLRNWGPYYHNDEIQMGRIFNCDPYMLRFRDIDGTAARITEWRGQKAKIRLYYHAAGSGAWSYTDLGTFTVEDITPSGPEATMRLVGLERLFMDAKADELKEGDSWFTNITLPDLIERVCEVGSDGKVTLASKPGTLKLTASEGRYFSAVGLLPRKDNLGLRNVSRNFVCRRQWYDSGYHWFVGYDAVQNKPAVMRWNEPTESWQYTVATTSTLSGFEAVSGTYDSTNNRLMACAIINRTGQQQPTVWGHNPINHDMLILRFNSATTTLSYSTSYGGGGEANAAPVYLPMQIATFPKPSSQTYYWGPLYGIEDKDSIASPFSCMIHGAGYSYKYPGSFRSTSWFLRKWGSDTPSKEGEPIRRDEVRGDYVSGGASLEGDGTPYGQNVTDGYYMANTIWGFTPPAVFPLNAYANGGFHDAFRYDDVRNSIYWIAYYYSSNHASGEWRLYKFSLATLAFSYHTLNFGTGYNSAASVKTYNVTAFDLFATDAANGRCYIATVDHSGTNNNPTSVHLWKFSLPASGTMSSPVDMLGTGAFESAQVSVSHTRRYCPQIYSIRHNPNKENLTDQGVPLCGGVINRYSAAGPCYGMWYYKDENYNGIFSHKDYLNYASHQFPVSTMPFEFSSNPWREDLTNPWWLAQDQATGRVYRSTFIMDPNKRIEMIASGDPVDRDNTWCSSNISCKDMTAYGVHASGPPAATQIPVLDYVSWINYAPTQTPQLGPATPEGRMLFWQYDNTLSDLVEVADFGDGSTWDALEMCRQLAGDYRMGIDKSGDLVMAVRGGTPSLYIAQRDEYATGFLSPTNRRIPCEEISSVYDYKAMANKYTIPIYEPGRDAPEYELILGSSSTADKAASIIADQVSNAAQRIILKCTTPSMVSSTDYDESIGALLFSWRLAYTSLTTSLKAPAQTNSSTIDVYGLYTGADSIARVADAKIYIGDNVQLEGGTVRSITQINTATGRITLDGTIGGSAAYAKGSVVTITPKDARRVGDSSDGVCSLVGATPTMSLLFTSNMDVTVDDTSRLTRGMLLSAGGMFMRVQKIVDKTTVSLRLGYLGSKYGNLLGTDTLPSGTPLAGFLWIEKGGVAYPISDTGATIMITPNSTGGVAGGIFLPGDRVIINCNGLQMREIEHSSTRSVDTASVARYGPHEWQNRVENKLLNETRGKVYLQTVTDLTDPPRVVSCTGLPLLPGMDIGTPVNVISRREFPDYPGIVDPSPTDYSVDCEVIGVKWDTEQGTMNLRCRSIEDIRRAGEAASIADAADLVAGRPRRPRRRIRR